MRPLRIVHCGIFNENDDGKFFYGLERKISHGLGQNGHLVYDFSYRDIERGLRRFGLKNLSKKKMNEKLVRVCVNLGANLLLIAKGEKIEKSTLEAIKGAVPNIKIALWYVDHLGEKKEWFEKISLFDAFFYANAAPLENLSKTYPNTIFSFFPNISDAAFDLGLNLEKTNDILYIGRDYNESTRQKFATLLENFCQKEGLKYEIYGSLGRRDIFGLDFFRAVGRSKIAVNFNRDDDLDMKNSPKILGASDRMAQFMGSGICFFSPKIRGFDRFFEDEKDLIFFENLEQCFEKITETLKNNKWQQIAQNGRQKALKIANAKRVAGFFLELIFGKNFGENLSQNSENSCEIFGQNFSQNYEWSEFIYKNGKKLCQNDLK